MSGSKACGMERLAILEKLITGYGSGFGGILPARKRRLLRGVRNMIGVWQLPVHPAKTVRIAA